ncbi:MAG: Gfo/Idh/MocA family oxidoreductase [bacterium]|nr:Gfo/Idh/MocA family oxidoreductase [bacterium]
MLQVFQNLKSGETYLEEIPAPAPGERELLIRSQCSLVSPGTERMLVEFGKRNLLQKARSQPERVRQVLDKIKSDGLMPTLEAVFAKLGEPLPLGYCNVGRVIEVGSGVTGFSPGDRVISNGPHAELVCAPANLCAGIPDNVNNDEAAFTVLASIGLQGIRLVKPTLGETVFVIGLGMIGLITAQLLRANGCRVIGADFDPNRLAQAEQFGCHTVDLSAGANPVESAMALTNARGVDAVLITASTASNDPVRQAARMCRQRGRIVLVGVTGLDLDRNDFYKKELSFSVSCSYGPGRYDSGYEESGNDYPIGFVRWTEQRNFEAILDLLATGNLDVKSMISDRVPFAQAPTVYSKLVSGADTLGILLEYAAEDENRVLRSTLSCGPTDAGGDRFGIIGAGNFTRRTLLPALKRLNRKPTIIASASGRMAGLAAREYGIKQATSDTEALLTSTDLDLVMITTRHDSHADLTVSALQAGKHVFVEKPLAIDLPGLRRIGKAYSLCSEKHSLMVGFNRRFSPHLKAIRERSAVRSGPLCLNYTVNAGAIPADVWIQDLAVGGGRIVGEGCHFIDVFRFLTGSPVTQVKALAVDGAADGIDADKVSILLKADDGSIGTIHYWANGHGSYPKENLELFFDGAVVRMENFRRTQAWGLPGFKTLKTRKQDKGHQEQFRLLLERLKSGGQALIPYAELEEVALVSLAARESVDTGDTQYLADWHQRIREVEEELAAPRYGTGAS